ncbi:MAG: insulinase family protein [Bacteroidales bacterium]|jgi:zinc protease|nr:insulinase family protein [Bacteroidales bacterium]MDI9575392.1 insulinase family protein [Bacteroidota bacterium]MDY0401545.1 insulinase family protein [Bacteroidales bacterium]HHW60010.1 insulinase family protein [Bacteroidales bacterium]
MRPNIITPTKPKIPEVNEINLSDNNKIYTFHTTRTDLVSLYLIIPLGYKFANNPVIGKFAWEMIKSGTKQKTAIQIAEEINYYGASIDISVGPDSVNISLIALNNLFIHALNLLFELLTDPTYPKKELILQKQETLGILKIKNKRVDFIANKNFFKLLFGNNHPYGKHIKYSDILLTSRKNLITFQKKYFDFSNSLWGLAGNYNDEIIRFITEHYDILPHLNIKDLKLSTGMPSQKQLHINKKDSLQTAIKIGCQIKSLKEKDYPYFLIGQTIFGGYFGSRLNKNIREDKGLTYGIYCRTNHFKHQAAWSISAEVKAEQTNFVIDEIKKEYDKFVNDTISNEELDRVRNYLMGTSLFAFDGAFNIIKNKLKMIDLGTSMKTYYENLFYVINEAKENEIREKFVEYVPWNKMIRVTVGKK